MRAVARGIGVAVPAIIGAALVSASVTMTPTPHTMSAEVQLQATYGMKGTQFWPIYVMSDEALQDLATDTSAISPATFQRDVNVVRNDLGVYQLQQATGNDTAPVVFGYSQGAYITSGYKKAFNAARHPEPTRRLC